MANKLLTSENSIKEKRFHPAHRYFLAYIFGMCIGIFVGLYFSTIEPMS